MRSLASAMVSAHDGLDGGASASAGAAGGGVAAAGAKLVGSGLDAVGRAGAESGVALGVTMVVGTGRCWTCAGTRSGVLCGMAADCDTLLVIGSLLPNKASKLTSPSRPVITSTTGTMTASPVAKPKPAARS